MCKASVTHESVRVQDWQCKAPIKLCEKAMVAQQQGEGQEVVVLAKVMAADINAGYQDISNIQVIASVMHGLLLEPVTYKVLLFRTKPFKLLVDNALTASVACCVHRC
jgi:PDZ domain